MIIVLTALYISSQLKTKQKTKQLLLVGLLIVGSIDLGINSGLLANSLCMNDLEYTSYRKNQEKIIRNIQNDRRYDDLPCLYMSHRHTRKHGAVRAKRQEGTDFHRYAIHLVKLKQHNKIYNHDNHLC